MRVSLLGGFPIGLGAAINDRARAQRLAEDEIIQGLFLIVLILFVYVEGAVGKRRRPRKLDPSSFHFDGAED